MTSNLETWNNKNDIFFLSILCTFLWPNFLFQIIFIAFHIFYYCKIMRQYLKNDL